MSKLANLMIGLVIFSMIVTGTVRFTNDFRDKYDVDIESDWEQEYDVINNMTAISTEMQDILESEDSNWVTSGLRVGLSILKNVLAVPRLISDILSKLATRLGLPAWIALNITTILIITLFFIIAAALLRWWV